MKKSRKCISLLLVLVMALSLLPMSVWADEETVMQETAVEEVVTTADTEETEETEESETGAFSPEETGEEVLPEEETEKTLPEEPAEEPVDELVDEPAEEVSLEDTAVEETTEETALVEAAEMVPEEAEGEGPSSSGTSQEENSEDNDNPAENEYRVDCWVMDESYVKVNGKKINVGQKIAFTENTELVFTLTPPQNDKLKDITELYRVEVQVNGEEPKQLDVSGLSFTYTPTKTDGFIIRVYWDKDQYDYDTFNPEEGYYTVNLNWEGDAQLEPANEELSHRYYFNNLRAILSTTESSFVLNLSPNDGWFLKEVWIGDTSLDLAECYDSATGKLTLSLDKHDSWDFVDVHLVFAEPYNIAIHYDTNALDVKNGETIADDGSRWTYNDDGQIVFTITPKKGENFYGIHTMWWLNGVDCVSWLTTDEAGIKENADGSYTLTIDYESGDEKKDYNQDIELISYLWPFSNEYRVDCWVMDDSSVKVNGEEIIVGAINQFAGDEVLTFTLTPPQNDKLKDITELYCVEVQVNGKETVEVPVDGLSFTYTPTSTEGFTIHVYWDKDQYDYENLCPTDEDSYTVDLFWDGDARVQLNEASYFFNNLRKVLSTETDSLELTLLPGDGCSLREVQIGDQIFDFENYYNSETGVLTLPLGEHNSWDWVNVYLNFDPDYLASNEYRMYYDAFENASVALITEEQSEILESAKTNTFIWNDETQESLTFRFAPPEESDFVGLIIWQNGQNEATYVEVENKEGVYEYTFKPASVRGFTIDVYWQEDEYRVAAFEANADETALNLNLNGCGWIEDVKVDGKEPKWAGCDYAARIAIPKDAETLTLTVSNGEGECKLNRIYLWDDNVRCPVDFKMSDDGKTCTISLSALSNVLDSYTDWVWMQLEFSNLVTIDFDAEQLDVDWIQTWTEEKTAVPVNLKDNGYVLPGEGESLTFTVTPKEGEALYGIQLDGYGESYFSEYTNIKDCIQLGKCAYEEATGTYTFTIPYDETVNYDMYIYFYSDKEWFELDSYEPGENQGAVTVWAEGVGQIDEVWLDDKKVDEEDMRRADNALRFLVPADTDTISFVVSNGEYTYKLNQVIDVSGEEDVSVPYKLTDDVCAIAVEDILQENQAYYWLGLEFSPRLTVEYDDEQLDVKIRNGEELETVDLEDNVYLQPGVKEYMEFTVTPKDGEAFYGIRVEGYGDYFCEYTSVEKCVESGLCVYDKTTNTYTFRFDYDENVWYDKLIHFYGAEGWFELDSYEPGEDEGAVTVWAEGLGWIDEVWLDGEKIDEEDMRRADSALRFLASADTKEISFVVSNGEYTYKLNQVIDVSGEKDVPVEFTMTDNVCTIAVKDILQEDQAYYWLGLEFSGLLSLKFDSEQLDVNWIQTWNDNTAVPVDPEDNGYVQPGVDEYLEFTVTPKEGETFYGLCIDLDDESGITNYCSVADCLSKEGGGSYDEETNTYTIRFDYHPITCDCVMRFAEGYVEDSDAYVWYDWDNAGDSCRICIGRQDQDLVIIPADDVTVTSTTQEGDCQHEAVKTCMAAYTWGEINLTDTCHVTLEKGSHKLNTDGICTVEGCGYVKPQTELATVNKDTPVSKSVAGIDSTEKETVATILADTLNEEAETNTALKQIKEDIADGKVKAVTSVDVEMKTGTEVDNAIKQIADKKDLSDVVVAGCFDVDIEIKNQTSGETLVTLEETSQPITITVVLTEEVATLLRTQQSLDHEIYVMREHQGSYDLLPATLDGNVLTFSSNKFSEFSILALNPKDLIDNDNIKVKDLQGDTDGNGQITTMDLIHLVKYLLDSIKQTDVCCDADLNGDGEFDLADLVYLLKQLMKTPD